MAGTNKVTKVEKQNRVELCMAMLLEGYRPGEIFHFISQKPTEKVATSIKRRYQTTLPWNITHRQLGNYLKVATAEIEKSVEKNIERVFTTSAARLDHLYKRAIERGESKLGLAVMREFNSIYGLHKKQHVFSGEVTTKSQKLDLTDLSNDELATLEAIFVKAVRNVTGDTTREAEA